MLLRINAFLMLLVIFLPACADRLSTNIDAEPALAVLGGAVLATQNVGRVAFAPPKRSSSVNRLIELFDPISEAIAAPPDCNDVTVGTCTGAVLRLYYNNCQTVGLSQAGYWHSYVEYTFANAGICAAVLGAGVDPVAVPALVTTTVTRTWGIGPNGDQNNLRVGDNIEVAYFYSEFPSGWQDDRVGGVTVEFETPTRRRILVPGVHAIGVRHTDPVVPDPNSFNLLGLPTDHADHEIGIRWDHTINTITTGDPLFQIGPTIIQNPDTTISFTDLQNNTVATFDGDIVIDSGVVARGAALRVQHNLSESLGVVVVTEPLVYSDPTCCYPMSGTVYGQFDRNLRAPTLEEEIVFTGTSCGAILHTNLLSHNEAKVLKHCF